MSETKPSFATMGRFAMIPFSFIENAKRMKVHTRWLYVALVYYFNTKNGIAFPSYDTLTKLTGLRREMISNGIKELERDGWITRKRRFGNSTLYTVIFNKDSVEPVVAQSAVTEASDNNLNANNSSGSISYFEQVYGSEAYENLFGRKASNGN